MRSKCPKCGSSDIIVKTRVSWVGKKIKVKVKCKKCGHTWEDYL